MLRRASETTDLRAQLNKALRKGQVMHALDLYELIETRKPDEPRWPHRKGDLLVRLGRKPEAADAYERAVVLYMKQGFEARAAATAKIMLAVDPNRPQLLGRSDPNLPSFERSELVTRNPDGSGARRRSH